MPRTPTALPLPPGAAVLAVGGGAARSLGWVLAGWGARPTWAAGRSEAIRRFREARDAGEPFAAVVVCESAPRRGAALVHYLRAVERFDGPAAVVTAASGETELRAAFAAEPSLLELFRRSWREQGPRMRAAVGRGDAAELAGVALDVSGAVGFVEPAAVAPARRLVESARRGDLPAAAAALCELERAVAALVRTARL